MRKNDWVRLRHMLDAAREAVSLAGRESRASVGENRTIALALVKLVEIIGEAATSVANERRKKLAPNFLGEHYRDEKSPHPRLLRH